MPNVLYSNKMQCAAFGQKPVNDLCSLVWGESISDTIFNQWSQGFDWSANERCALIQHFGGPCAVIAPVQAYLLKKLLFEEGKFEENLPVLSNRDLCALTDNEREELFLSTLNELLLMMNSSVWFLCIHLADADVVNPTEEIPENADSSNVQTSRITTNSCENNSSFQQFHRNIKFLQCNSKSELANMLRQNHQHFTSKFGVITFLYSMLSSKGIKTILNEMDNPEIALIDSTHGHGSQNLINLFLCGQAVSNVFDGERDIGGLKLRGIPESYPCTIGFLTLLEQLRYCTVGEALKRPQYPIWLIGSETHLSLMFTHERLLVRPESAVEQACKIFDQFDPEDNGFIPSAALENILVEMNLVSEPEYVKVMCENLDPEELGIIVRSKFFDEFFSNEDIPTLPDSFVVYHYNGLGQSSPDNIVRFRKGTAKQIDWQENSEKACDSPIESCLQMRWAGLWITWEDGHAPSIN